MKIAIIGTGKMGRGFATALSPKHEVIVGSRDVDKARRTVSRTRAARGGSYRDAGRRCRRRHSRRSLVAMDETLTQLGQLKGTVVIDLPVRQARARGPERQVNDRSDP
jgi:predicted dinucleotide-binding enzyme